MANWKLHKYYRGFCLPTIRSRLIQLNACTHILKDDDVHELLKRVTNTPSNAGLSNKEFLDFLEQIWCIAAHLDIYLPYPEEITKMEQLHRIVDKLENKVFPYRELIERGSYPLDSESKLSINKAGVGITSRAFDAEHLDICTTGSGSLVQTRIFFAGTYLDDIERGLDHFISSVVDDLRSPHTRKKVIEHKIKELQEELSNICE